MVIAVIIPCYCVKDHILAVLSKIGPEVQHIVVVDDCCPEQSGKWVEQKQSDPRVSVLYNPENFGVGKTVMTGYDYAAQLGAHILVKVDGDGQMNPHLISHFVTPIQKNQADYTKGNRFWSLHQIHRMPLLRIIGNAALSFMAKISTGYWNLFDPTNGFTAIHANVWKACRQDKISPRYFFETDLLFRLNTIRAVVIDIPMDAVYGTETSQVRISRVLPEFLLKHSQNLLKRIFYNYFLRDLTLASLQLVFGLSLFTFGVVNGLIHWHEALLTQTPTPLGTIMVAALTTILGFQLLLAFLAYDISNLPQRPIHSDLNF